ncbi:MAG: SDR family oxidoreductase [Jatrophihabitans sp.]|nr:MAG: SDR family oxidoreductase [Jatrophihabitans sp.]
MRQRILITGASSGLGAQMARQWGASGRDLALCARRLDRLTALRDELGLANPAARVEVRALDVTDFEAVLRTFAELDETLGGLDRVVVNAGLGKGAPIGTGRFAANRETIETNVLGALAQCEAAMQLFRARGRGHLVVISSMSARRGMPGSMTAYAASKAAVASLAEGLRAELIGTPIKVTTLFPGYIRSEMHEKAAGRTPLMSGTEAGVRAMIRAIEREVAASAVPPWPWKALTPVLRYAPLRLVRRLR